MSGYDYSQDTANEMLEERDKIISELEAQHRLCFILVEVCDDHSRN